MAADGCIVHCNKKVLEFYDAFNQLRREKKFHADIYQQLLSECCSCDGQTELKEIDLKVLRKICHHIQVSWAFKVHVPFTKNLNKLTLTKRSKSKRKQISKNAIKNELEHQLNTYDDGWYEYDDDLHYTSSYDIWEERADRSRYLISQLSISSKHFKPTVAFDGCIVHDLKYESKFRQAVQQLRRVSDFPRSIYNHLSEKCCSCNGKKGLNVIDPMILRDICYEIESELPCEQESNEPVYLLMLPLGSTFNLAERRRKIGLFIGKKGRHVSAVQNKYNVRVSIVIESSSMQLRRNLTTLLDNTRTRRMHYANNELYLILTKMDTSVKETILIDEIKQTLMEKWKKINESEYFNKSSGSIR